MNLSNDENQFELTDSKNQNEDVKNFFQSIYQGTPNKLLKLIDTNQYLLDELCSLENEPPLLINFLENCLKFHNDIDENNEKDLIDILILAMPCSDFKYTNGKTIAMYLAQNSNAMKRYIEGIIRQQTNINNNYNWNEIFNAHDNNGKNLIMYSAASDVSGNGITILLKWAIAFNEIVMRNGESESLLKTSKELLDNFILQIDNSGDTALIHAVKNHNVNAAKSLLEGVSYKNAESHTVYLFKPESHIDLQNNEGKTALMIAIEMGKFEMVKLLLEYNASVDFITREGKTILDLAPNDEIRKLLRAYLSQEYIESINNKKNILRSFNSIIDILNSKDIEEQIKINTYFEFYNYYLDIPIETVIPREFKCLFDSIIQIKNKYNTSLHSLDYSLQYELIKLLNAIKYEIIKNTEVCNNICELSECNCAEEKSKVLDSAKSVKIVKYAIKCIKNYKELRDIFNDKLKIFKEAKEKQKELELTYNLIKEFQNKWRKYILYKENYFSQKLSIGNFFKYCLYLIYSFKINKDQQKINTQINKLNLQSANLRDIQKLMQKNEELRSLIEAEINETRHKMYVENFKFVKAVKLISKFNKIQDLSLKRDLENSKIGFLKLNSNGFNDNLDEAKIEKTLQNVRYTLEETGVSQNIFSEKGKRASITMPCSIMLGIN